MATYKPVSYTYGEYDEIAFMSRNDMNLAVWEAEGRVRLYSYGYEDTFRERVGRFLHNGFRDLYDNQQLFDLQVTVDGQAFSCHGIILASISGFFKDELRSEELRSRRLPDQPDKIVLDEGSISADTFKLLLDMIYDGRDVIKQEHALDLMKASTYLRIRALEYRCMDILVKQIEERTCMKIWDWAEANNIPTLASKAKGMALSCFQVLRHTEDYLRIPMERLTMMLGHELLKYRNEDDILEAIMDWVEFDVTERRKYLKELLPFVCFPYLSTRLLNDLRKHELIGLRSEFASHVDEALTYHLASFEKDGKKTQVQILRQQAQSLKRLMPGMRRVVLLIGGSVVQEEPLTNVVACYMDMAHPMNRFREILQFSIASLPHPVGLRFASAEWKHNIYVSGGSRSPDALLVYKPHNNTWHLLKSMPQGREGHSMVASDGMLYVLGGRVSSKDGFKVVSDISQYDIHTDTWRPAGQLAVAVESAPAVLFSDKIYVFGGRTASGNEVGLVQRLDLETGQSEVVGQLPHNVENAKAIVLGRDMVLVCPNGTIYTIHESSRRSRRVTFAEDDDILSSLDSVSLTSADLRVEEGEGKRQEGDSAVLERDTSKKAKGQMDWSIVDGEGAERVPQLKKAVDDDDSSPNSFLPKDKSDADAPKTNATADEEETKLLSVADAEKPEETAKGDENDDDKKDTEDMKETGNPPSKNDDAAAVDEDEDDVKDEGEERDDDKREEEEEDDKEKEAEKAKAADNPLPDQTPNKKNTDESHDAVNDLEDKKPEDAAENGEKSNEDGNHDEEENEDNVDEEEEEEDEGNVDKEEEEDSTNHPVDRDAPTPPTFDDASDIVIDKIATMEKRRDFGLFIRKADVMVVGGQSENGFFLDDILKIHIPTGKVCKTDSKLLIPISGMQVECTVIHQNFLLQFFDAASCFYGE